jgi:hypothetical protein
MLTAVGILLILAGCLAGCGTLTLPLVLLAPRPTVTPSGAPMPPRPPAIQLIPGMVIYAVIAATLVTLGIGSIRKRRWVRPVMLVLAWLGLILGVMSVIFMALIFPDMLRNIRANLPTPPAGTAGPPAQFLAIIMASVAGAISLLYIAVPALLIFLFKGPDVQATLEFYDPVPRWTDGVPLHVLGLCAILFFTALWMLVIMIQGVMPLFGVFLTGTLARILVVPIAAVFFFTAYQTYRMRLLGWRLAMVLLILLPISACITFAIADVSEIYRRSGVTAEQMNAMPGLMRMMGPFGAIWAGVVGVATVFYTARIRKLFTSENRVDVPLDDAAR